MRQKIRLAQAIAHHPRVLVLDEPLNGLDPMARAESLALFQELGRQGMHVVISSHILDEVDRIADRVVLITGGYLIAQGNIHDVRREVRDKPMQVLIRCDSPELLASKMFAVNHCVEARLHADGRGVFLRTGDIDQFYRLLNEIAVEGLVKIDAVAPDDLKKQRDRLKRASSLRSSALNVRNGSFRRRDMRSVPISRQATPLYRNPRQSTH